MSLSALAFALEISEGRISVPRFSRIEVGRRRRISLLNVASRVEGEREVVISGRGSARPDSRLYSSSMVCWASMASWSRDSSYLKSLRRVLSLAMAGSRGFPVARDRFS